MIQYDPSKPEKYAQPEGEYAGRVVNDFEEQMDYLPNTHLRIWYNTETEGFALHHHEAFEIILCVEKTYTVIANNMTFHMEAGDIIIIPPHMPHKIINTSAGARFVGLFDLSFYLSFTDYKTLEPVFQQAYFCTTRLHPGVYQRIYSCYMRAIDSYFTRAVFWETTIFRNILKIFTLIASEHYTNIPNSSYTVIEEKPKEHYEKITSLLNYIDENYMENITLEDAAAYIGFSKYHFSRLFKQYTEQTFYDYLCRKRISVAQIMLSTNASVTEIAFQTGFNSPTAFCRCFKKITNLSPSAYRSRLSSIEPQQ